MKKENKVFHKPLTILCVSLYNDMSSAFFAFRGFGD